MKKNIIVLSVLSFIVLSFIVLNEQVLFNQGAVSVLGDVATSDSSTSSTQYAAGIGITPLQERDGELASSYLFSADPGSKIESALRLVNQNNDTDLIADVYVVGSNPNASLPTPLSRKTPGPEAAWISIAKNVPLKKGAFQDVPFTISIPGNARPGDHVLSIMVETIRPEDVQMAKQSSKQGAKIKISSAVAARVSLKISGKEVIAAQIKDLKMISKKPYSFNIAVENTGNVTVKPKVVTTIDSVFGTVPPESIPSTTTYEILPGGVANMVVIWDYKKMGIYTLNFSINYGDKKEVRDVKVVIYPTIAQASIALLLLILIIGGGIYFIRRRGQSLTVISPVAMASVPVSTTPVAPLAAPVSLSSETPPASPSPPPSTNGAAQNTLPQNIPPSVQ